MEKVKFFCYSSCVAQRVGSGIGLLFHDRSIRRGWVVNNMPWPHFTPGKDPVPILQEAGWAPGLVWTGGKSRPHRDSIPDCPAHSQLLYLLSYLAHRIIKYWYNYTGWDERFARAPWCAAVVLWVMQRASTKLVGLPWLICHIFISQVSSLIIRWIRIISL